MTLGWNLCTFPGRHAEVPNQAIMLGLSSEFLTALWQHWRLGWIRCSSGGSFVWRLADDGFSDAILTLDRR
jgi:hypothetical protein